ncbi:hypothetical protein HYW87_01990 [Candidatus Roizmanbacteria bacterium]|nr:hypothetical protein [Candidatus Roizmanbacteria bacterium]
MPLLSDVWLEILSELFVNLAAAWFAIVFIEPLTRIVQSPEGVFILTLKFILGILSLVIAKNLREELKKR